MAQNKVVYYGDTLIDLTGDTVSEDKVLNGYVFHKPDGTQSVGTFVPEGGSAIAVTEEEDEHGGIIKHIVAVDLSDDTVTPSTQLQGVTAHDFQGRAITGTYVPGGGSVSLQSKTATPTTSSQLIVADTGYDGLSDVTVNAIPSEYIIPSGSQTITENGTVDVSALASVNVNVPGGAVKMGVLRPDAELVQRWTYDKMLIADEGFTIPSYSTSNHVIKASENIATYNGDPLTYRYYITVRFLTIPEYSITTLAKGREEYVFTVGAYEWVYNPSGQLQTLDGSKSYGQYSQVNALGPISKEIYWSSATGISVYTSSGFCLNQNAVAPTIGGNKTITIKSPQINIRGHATYLSQTFYEAITDARVQYIIELWRAPIESDIINGWAFTSLTDHVLNDVKNNGGTLT